ncbi:MAG: sulfatase [Planctomycetota bacterium]|jgi:arylsulfatase A-like enzyme
MRTIFICMDSLNRHYLSAYGNDRVKTPNLDRLAARGLTFDSHWCGSMPCMPARREMMTGRYNMFECPWGPIEPWDDCLPVELQRQKGVYSHLITDHYHYFHRRGEGYHDLFTSWEFERGQESDVWMANLNHQEAVKEHSGRGRNTKAYWRNRNAFDPEEDLSYPTPRCFQRAAEFVESNHNQDNWHLHLEVFDPHEPFDSPQRYRDMYADDGYEGPLFNWPAYDHIDEELDTPEVVAHIRRRYAASLTMADHWLGKFLDKMDEHDLWQDTVLILTTDHGHLLGEHGYWAKNYCRDFAELAHIPMIVCAPNAPAGERRSGMTTTIDTMPTILSLHGAEAPQYVQGQDFSHLLTEDAAHRDWVLWGYFGKDVNLYDGNHIYTRQSNPEAKVYQYTLMPTGYGNEDDRKALAGSEAGVYLPTTYGVPHLRIERQCHRHQGAPDHNLIFDYAADPHQENCVRNESLESTLAEKMKNAMETLGVMPEQLTRLGF